jgi:hypothetical protein
MVDWSSVSLLDLQLIIRRTLIYGIVICRATWRSLPLADLSIPLLLLTKARLARSDIPSFKSMLARLGFQCVVTTVGVFFVVMYTIRNFGIVTLQVGFLTPFGLQW